MIYKVIKILYIINSNNKMLNNLPIYTIGDSHSRFSFEYNLNENTRHPRITNSFWLGPITMHRVGRDSI